MNRRREPSPNKHPCIQFVAEKSPLPSINGSQRWLRLFRTFSLGRCWNSKTTGKETHGSTFFEKNEQDLVRAIHETTTWLRTRILEADARSGE